MAVSNAGLLGAMITLDPNSIVDFGLSFTLPIHAYLGMGAIITDYLPQRKFPFIYPFVKGALCLVTGLTIYGLFKFNTDNIGFSAFIKTLWKADQKAPSEKLADE